MGKTPVISLNPRGTLWTNDPNKYGQRLLQKMGWKPGQGLGVLEDGAVDPIRIPYKSDTKGFGCKEIADPWLDNQEDFKLLLQELNGKLVKGSLDVPVGLSSLTEKSKHSRKRVHYHKFAQSKDLSCRSSKELACIFGDKNIANISDITKSDCSVSTPSDSHMEETEKKQKGKMKLKKVKLQTDSVKGPAKLGVVDILVNERGSKKRLKQEENGRSCERNNEEAISTPGIKKSRKKAKSADSNAGCEHSQGGICNEEHISTPGKKKLKRKCELEVKVKVESNVEETRSPAEGKCNQKVKKHKKAGIEKKSKCSQKKLKKCEKPQSKRSLVAVQQSDSEVKRDSVQLSIANKVCKSIVKLRSADLANFKEVEPFKGANFWTLKGYGYAISGYW